MTTNQAIDKETVYLKVIREVYPNLEVRSARLHTSDGQFNDILFINDDLIFRFPRYEESIDGFLREIEVLEKLQGRVNLPIPHPIYVSSGTRAVGKVFMGYQLLPGKPLFRDVLNTITDEPTRERLAQQLADFLYGLHTLSPSVLGLELPVHDAHTESRKLYARSEEHTSELQS